MLFARLLLNCACNARTALRNFVSDDLTAPEVEGQIHHSVIRFSEEIRSKRDYIIRVIRRERITELLIRGPVLRAGIAAGSVHSLHRGKLVAVEGCRNRKAASRA